MGLFRKKTPEEKQKSIIYMGLTMQPIGKIPLNGAVGITLKPDRKVLNIHHNDIDITIPYERLYGFKTDSETKLMKAGNSLGGALVGGAIAGGVGALIGAGKNKGKTEIRWISTLTYIDKSGELKELYFIDYGLTGPYSGKDVNYPSCQISSAISEIVSENAENITEL